MGDPRAERRREAAHRPPPPPVPVNPEHAPVHAGLAERQAAIAKPNNVRTELGRMRRWLRSAGEYEGQPRPDEERWALLAGDVAEWEDFIRERKLWNVLMAIPGIKQSRATRICDALELAPHTTRLYQLDPASRRRLAEVSRSMVELHI